MREDSQMKALLVLVNGERLCLAGVGKDGVLNAGVTWVGGKRLEGRGKITQRLELMVGGLNSITREHLRWHSPKRLKVGDEITIKVVSAKSVDSETYKFKPKTDKLGRILGHRRSTDNRP